MNNFIRIGTRSSALAVWQAKYVQNILHSLGIKSELVLIDSKIDMELPLHELGTQGIFTTELDNALINKDISIAVHSMKDVPTNLPDGIVNVFMPERGPYQDVFVKKDSKNNYKKNIIVGTGSVRRKSQWLHKYPTHTTKNLRGNVPTRLKKLDDQLSKENIGFTKKEILKFSKEREKLKRSLGGISEMKKTPDLIFIIDTNIESLAVAEAKKLGNLEIDGIILAKAGLERLNLFGKNCEVLDWMVPAPAQGAIVVSALESETKLINELKKLNHNATSLCVKHEREFMKSLEGGCNSPIGAISKIVGNKILFKGCVTEMDGHMQIEIEKEFNIETLHVGIIAAKEIIKKGALKIIK